MAKWSDFLGHAATSAIIGAVVGAMVSWPVSHNVAMSTIAPSQDRQMRLEQVVEFSQEADEFLSLGVKIIPKLNAKSSFNEEKIAIADASGRQAIKAQSLIDLFGSDIEQAATAYQTALEKFVKTTNNLQDPSGIKGWVEALDGVVTTQRLLKDRMYAKLDVKTRASVSTASF